MASRVLPVVRLFFACDSAVADLADLPEPKWILKHPWHTVGMPPGRVEKHIQPEITLYAQLTDGLGEFTLSVELRDFDTGTRIGHPSQPEKWTFGGDKLTAAEVVFRMTNVPFPTPGHYVFVLKANHAELDGGTSVLRVLPG